MCGFWLQTAKIESQNCLLVNENFKCTKIEKRVSEREEEENNKTIQKY